MYIFFIEIRFYLESQSSHYPQKNKCFWFNSSPEITTVNGLLSYTSFFDAYRHIHTQSWFLSFVTFLFVYMWHWQAGFFVLLNNSNTRPSLNMLVSKLFLK